MEVVETKQRCPYFLSKRNFVVTPSSLSIRGTIGGGGRRRRWEDLDSDLLANVFNRVGMKSLVLDVPFVCKSWYRATLNPLSWRRLEFPEYEPLPLIVVKDNVEDVGPVSHGGHFYEEFIEQNGIDKSRFSITRLVKLFIGRSKGNVIELQLPDFCSEEALRYASDMCPLLKDLVYCDDLLRCKPSLILPQVIGKWKLLESLTLLPRTMTCFERNSHNVSTTPCGRQYSLSKHFKAFLSSYNSGLFGKLVMQIGINCKHFKHLDMFNFDLRHFEASPIVTMLPNLRSLGAYHCLINRATLFKFLRGCKHLDLFYAHSCYISGGDAQRTLELASKSCDHFESFGCTGSVNGFSKNYSDITIILSLWKTL